MASLTLFPDADSASPKVSGDGACFVDSQNISWAALLAHAGISNSNSQTSAYWTWYRSHATNPGTYRERNVGVIQVLKTLAVSDVITAAHTNFKGNGDKGDSAGVDPDFAWYTIAPASPTEIVPSDMPTDASATLCTDIKTRAAMSLSGWNDFTENAAGLAQMNALLGSAVISRAFRVPKYDLAQVDPLCGVNTSFRYAALTADAGADSPYITLTYTPGATTPVGGFFFASVAIAVGSFVGRALNFCRSLFPTPKAA